MKNKTMNPVIINHNVTKGCYMLYWDNHYFLCKDVSFLLRKSNNNCCPCRKSCVSFQTEDALNKHLNICSDDKSNAGKRTLHKEKYLRFDKLYHKNKVPFSTYYVFK